MQKPHWQEKTCDIMTRNQFAPASQLYHRASLNARGDIRMLFRWRFKEKWGILPKAHFNTAVWEGHVNL